MSSTGTCPPRRRYSKRRSSKTSCWRNPIIVFLVSFLALGSLRFRVPARSKAAASILLLKRREARKQRNMIYTLMEEGTDAQKQSFKKFKAVLQTGEPVTVTDWATVISTATAKNVAMVELNRVIKEVPFDSVYFETPPVTKLTSESQPFEFVLVDAPRLHQAASENPNARAFSQHFTDKGSNAAAVFPNLGSTATLIAPKPIVEDLTTYSHLAKFVRMAPANQVAETWRLAAKSYLDGLSEKPTWFSTSGLGIYWLHFRLDETPKYYTHDPYKRTSRR